MSQEMASSTRLAEKKHSTSEETEFLPDPGPLSSPVRMCQGSPPPGPTFSPIEAVQCGQKRE